MEETVKHHTTFNVEQKVFSKLKDLAEQKETTISAIIKMLLKLVSKEMEYTEMPKRLIQYQRLPEDGEWHIFHIRLTIEEIEHFLDMRKFFKKSVSHLIAYGLEKYEETLQNSPQPQLGKDENKSIFPHYSFSRKTVSGQQYFIISWGETTKYPDMNEGNTPKEYPPC